MTPNKFTDQKYKSFYSKTSCNAFSNFELLKVIEEVIQKISLGFNTGKAAEMDKQMHNDMILVNLQKILDHEILLEKKYFGFQASVIE